MDKYKKLMCVKGLLMSLDEQFYRLDTAKKDMASKKVYSTVLDQYWDAVKEQLGFPNERERLIKELYKQGFISEKDRLKLLNVKIAGEGIDLKIKTVAFNIKINGVSVSWQKQWITAKDLVRLSQDVINPNDSWTITYVNNTHNGTLDTYVDSVKVEENMVFNVTKMIKE